MKTETYNGYTNYETWLVALHLDNSQGDQEMWNERAEDALRVTDFDNDKAINRLADEMEEELENGEMVEEMMKPLPSMYQDLLNGALSEVDWRDIAENYVQTAKDEMIASGEIEKDGE